MTLEEFGKSIKVKYPQYSDISDADLGQKMLTKYPQYKDMVSQPNILQKTQKYLGESSALPTVGATIGSILLPGGPGSAIGASAGERIRQTTAEGKLPIEESPLKIGNIPIGPAGINLFGGTQEQQKQVAATGITAGVTDKILGMAFSAAGKILPSVVKKISLMKGPAQLREAFGVAKTALWNQVKPILKNSEKVIDNTPILASLKELEKEYIEKGIKNASKEITKLADRLGPPGTKLTLSKAQALKQGMAEDVGQKGFQSGPGKGAINQMKKKALKIMGGELGKEITEAAPDVAPLLDEYGKLSILSENMKRPFKNWWAGSVAGMAAQPLGIASPLVSVGVSAAAMPYTNYIIKRLLQSGVQTVAGPVGRPIITGASANISNKLSR